MRGESDIDTDQAFSPSIAEVTAIQMMLDGATDEEIARRLEVSVTTIRLMIRMFREKVGASNRYEAVIIGVLEGMLTYRQHGEVIRHDCSAVGLAP